jgi:hypothetical protein
MIEIERGIVERALAALIPTLEPLLAPLGLSRWAALTKRGHPFDCAAAPLRSGQALAQRVGHEHRGYCGWQSESPRCPFDSLSLAQGELHRALVAELEAALGREDG